MSNPNSLFRSDLDKVLSEPKQRFVSKPREEAVLAQATPFGEETFTLTKFNPTQLSGLSLQEKRQRYIDLLGRFTNLIVESANRNTVPPQLVATIILNELDDIGESDLIGETLSKGSLGMAQIQISTAIDLGLIDGSRDEVARKLKQPRFAIEAAARMIRMLLIRMSQNVDKPRQKQLGFSLSDFKSLKNGTDLYNFVSTNDPLLQEKRAAALVAAAYNSPDIVIAQKEESVTEGSPKFIYANAVTHGDNAALLAEVLVQPPALFHQRT